MDEQAFAGATEMAAPPLTPLCRIVARVDPVVSLGDIAYGERRYVPIIGGTVEGKLSGEVLSGGADWQIQRRDGVLDIEAHYVIRTVDKALIEVSSRGCRHGPPQVMARLAAGGPVRPDEYYFRTFMSFRTAAPAWQRLNALLAIGKGTRQPGAAVLEVFIVN